MFSKLLLPLMKYRNLFVTWTPDLTNFTIKRDIVFTIHTKDSVITAPVANKDVRYFIHVLQQSVFSKDKFVIGWNLKELFSYLRFQILDKTIPNNRYLRWRSDFFDLKLGEAFLGINKEQPKTYDETIERLRAIINDDMLMKVSKDIYNPLMIEVLPTIETMGLANREAGVDYCCYDIEGQVNGRLNTKMPDDIFFNPHNLTNKQKDRYAAGHEKKFLVIDYKHYEASVLAWLSKDKVLNGIIESGEDIYSKIWRMISNTKICTEEERNLIKSIFLPIVYGSGVNRISELTGYSTRAAEHLIVTINKNFTTVFEWIKGYQDQLKTQSSVRDYFGRVLDFSEKSGRDVWSVRNAIIQAPAALIYLEKLVQLHKMHESMDILASIHDAFVCRIDAKNSNSIIVCAKELLESPSPIAPGLVLKVETSIGDSWGNPIKININNKAEYNDYSRDEDS